MAENLPAGQLRVEHHVLRQVADVLGYLGIASRAFQHGNLALGGLHQAQDKLDRGGFTRAVVAEQAQNFPRLQPKIYPVQHRGLVVTVTDVLQSKTVHRISDCRWSGIRIKGWGSLTPADFTTGKASWTQRRVSTAGLNISTLASGYFHSSRSTLSFGS